MPYYLKKNGVKNEVVLTYEICLGMNYLSFKTRYINSQKNMDL